MILSLFNVEDELQVRVALLDVDPEPEDPESEYFTTLDIETNNSMSNEDWLEFFEELNVTGEDGALLTPDDGDIYLERLQLLFRGGLGFSAQLTPD